MNTNTNFPINNFELLPSATDECRRAAHRHAFGNFATVTGRKRGVIGKAYVAECSVQLSHETAAWTTIIQVPTGYYPVVVPQDGRDRTPYVVVAGVVAFNHTPSLWGGLRIGRDDHSWRSLNTICTRGISIFDQRVAGRQVLSFESNEVESLTK